VIKKIKIVIRVWVEFLRSFGVVRKLANVSSYELGFSGLDS